MNTTMSTLKVLADSSTNRTVLGSRVDVRRYVFSLGLSLGAPEYFLESTTPSGTPVYDTSRQVGNALVDVDGKPAGLLLMADDRGAYTATVGLQYV